MGGACSELGGAWPGSAALRCVRRFCALAAVRQRTTETEWQAPPAGLGSRRCTFHWEEIFPAPARADHHVGASRAGHAMDTRILQWSAGVASECIVRLSWRVIHEQQEVGCPAATPHRPNLPPDDDLFLDSLAVAHLWTHTGRDQKPCSSPRYRTTCRLQGQTWDVWGSIVLLLQGTHSCQCDCHWLYATHIITIITDATLWFVLHTQAGRVERTAMRGLLGAANAFGRPTRAHIASLNHLGCRPESAPNPGCQWHTINHASCKQKAGCPGHHAHIRSTKASHVPACAGC